MKVLITGANGLLGQKIVLLLQQSNIDFLATGRGPCRLRNAEEINYSAMDITNEGEVRRIIDDYLPDAIVHCAAMTQVDDCERDPDTCHLINVTGTRNLIEASKEWDCFFLYVSTDFVFDGTFPLLDENAVPLPISTYGRSKLEAEYLVKASSMSWAIVRTVLVYGVADDPSRSNIVLWAKSNLENNKPIKVVTDQFRTPTLAEDLAIGCCSIIENQNAGIWHISGEEGMSPYDMAITVANFFHLDKTLITPIDASTFKEIGKRPLKTGFNIAKAKSTLNFKPRSFVEGLKLIKEQLENIQM